MIAGTFLGWHAAFWNVTLLKVAVAVGTVTNTTSTLIVVCCQ